VCSTIGNSTTSSRDERRALAAEPADHARDVDPAAARLHMSPGAAQLAVGEHPLDPGRQVDGRIDGHGQDLLLHGSCVPGCRFPGTDCDSALLHRNRQIHAMRGTLTSRPEWTFAFHTALLA
jgi:hypothetical protein